jgi:hypothetical protein
MSALFYTAYVGGWILAIAYLLSLRSSLGGGRAVWTAQPKWRRTAVFVLTDLIFLGMISLIAAPFFATSLPWALSVFAGSSTFAVFFSGSLTSAMWKGQAAQGRSLGDVFFPAAPLVGFVSLACIGLAWSQVALRAGWIGR